MPKISERAKNLPEAEEMRLKTAFILDTAIFVSATSPINNIYTSRKNSLFISRHKFTISFVSFLIHIFLVFLYVKNIKWHVSIVFFPCSTVSCFVSHVKKKIN